MSKLEDYIDGVRGSWFEFGRESGKKEAEERIIKLLLEHPLCVDVDYINYCDCSEEATEMDYKDHLIALIKGETE